MARALTAKTVENIKPDPNKRQEIPDPALTGLYLVVQPSGAKSWAVRYRHLGKPRKMTLGKWPVMQLAAARIAATTALEAVEHGGDPGAEKLAEKAERSANRDSISALASQFEKRHLSTLRSGAQAKYFLEAYMVSKWGDRDVKTITRRDVIELLDGIVDSGKAITANRVRAHLSKFFNWCVERDVIEVSPVMGVKPPAKESVRDRVLTDDEVRWFWQACDMAGYPWGALGKLLLLSGQRLREVAGMTESEIKGDLWRLSGARTKNKRPHDVPLSAAALDVLAGLPRIKGSTGHLITTTGETGVSGFHKARDLIAANMAAAAEKETGQPVEIPAWTWHDLRRTAATGLARLGVPVRVTEAVLNHVSGTGGGLVAVYQRHDYASEKRQALEAWSRLLEKIVDGERDNVVRLAGS